MFFCQIIGYISPLIFMNKEENGNEVTTGMPRRLNTYQVFLTVTS